MRDGFAPAVHHTVQVAHDAVVAVDQVAIGPADELHRCVFS